MEFESLASTSWTSPFILKILFGRKVDLVTVKGLHPRIRPFVEKE